VHLIAVDQLNPYDVLCSDDVVFTRSAFDSFVEAAPKGKPIERAESDESAEIADSTDAEETEA
jgi:large subunit ribosomal protein L4